MDTMQWMVVGLVGLSACGAGAFAGSWWSGRRAVELLVKIDKLEKARQLAGQHVAQARRQIEQLQKDLAAQHKARCEERAARKRDLNETLDAAYDRTLRIERPADEPDLGRPALPPHGFADTQPMA